MKTAKQQTKLLVIFLLGMQPVFYPQGPEHVSLSTKTFKVHLGVTFQYYIALNYGIGIWGLKP